MRAFVRSALECDTGARSAEVEVVEAASGFDALRLLPRGPYDLVITDINMPDINGLELVQFMRKSELHKATPVLLDLDPVLRARPRARAVARRRRLPGQAVHARRRLREETRAPARCGRDRCEPVRAGEWLMTDGQGARGVLLRGAGDRRDPVAQSARARRVAAAKGAVDPVAGERGLPRRSHAEGPGRPVRRGAAGHAVAPARGRARRSAARAGWSSRRRRSTCLFRGRRRLRPAARGRARGQRRRRCPASTSCSVELRSRRRRRGAAAEPRRSTTSSIRACSPCSPSTKSTGCARTSSRGCGSIGCACSSSSRPSTRRSRSSRSAPSGTARSSPTCPPARRRAPTRSSSICLMASRDDLATLIGSLGADNVVIEEIPRRARASMASRRAVACRAARRSRRRRREAAGARVRVERRSRVAAAERGRVAALADADGARRHPQARPPDEHRRRAGDRAQRAGAPHRAPARRGPAPARRPSCSACTAASSAA